MGGEPCNISLKWEARKPFNIEEKEGEEENCKRGKALIYLDYEPKTRQIQFELRQMVDLPKDTTLGLPGEFFFKFKNSIKMLKFSKKILFFT